MISYSSVDTLISSPTCSTTPSLDAPAIVSPLLGGGDNWDDRIALDKAIGIELMKIAEMESTHNADDHHNICQQPPSLTNAVDGLRNTTKYFDTSLSRIHAIDATFTPPSTPTLESTVMISPTSFESNLSTTQFSKGLMSDLLAYNSSFLKHLNILHKYSSANT